MQELWLNRRKPLVYGDVSGSTSWDAIKQMQAFALELGANIATFDTEMRMLPSHPSINFDVLTAFGHGGTDIQRSIRMLGYHMLETYDEYHVIYILGDLHMTPFRLEDIKNINVNFYVLAMGETQDAETAKALDYGKRLDACGLQERTKVLSFKEYVNDMAEAKARQNQ